MDATHAAAQVAYAWSATVGGLVPDDALATYSGLMTDPLVGSNVSAIMSLMAASPLVIGSNVYTSSGGLLPRGVYTSTGANPSSSNVRCLTVPLIGNALTYAPLDIGNGIIRPSVLSDGASTTSSTTSSTTEHLFASAWYVSGSNAPASLLTADLITGIVTATSQSFASSTVAALLTYPNVVLQSLTFVEGDVVNVTHALCSPAGATGVTFAASTFATPGSNVLVRAVGGECSLGTPATTDMRRVLARAAYLMTGPVGPVSPSASERWNSSTGVYETTFTVTPPATLSVLVAHGLGPSTAMRVLGAAVDDLATGTLLTAHVTASTALLSSLRVDVTMKTQAAVNPTFVADVAFHQLQLDASLAALMGAVPSQVGLDADLWVVPPLLLVSPEAARPFLQARFDELPVAREVARERGLRGALFVPPTLSPALGAFASDARAPLPLYRSGLASLSAWNFFRATSDVEWLRDVGYPLMRDVADAFASIITPRVGTTALGFSTATLPRVVAPDGTETDHDPFTLVVSFWAIKNALEASYELGFAGRTAWMALFDLTDAVGSNPLVSGITTSTAPLAAAWPLGFSATLLSGGNWPVSGDAPPPATGTFASSGSQGTDGALSLIAYAAFMAMRAQAQPFMTDRIADVVAGHAALTTAMHSVESRPWGVVRDPLVCGAYLLLHLSVYGHLLVTGGINHQRYSYAPYGVPCPVATGLALPLAFASITFSTVVDAGVFLITNELPWAS